MATTTKSLMIIIEKNTDGNVSNVGRKFLLDQINSLSTEAMAAGFAATIRELEAQIDAFIPASPAAEEPVKASRLNAKAAAKT